MITKKELLKRLKKENINIGGNPGRMITQYISLGLIDRPVRYGLGKGKGTVTKFNDNIISQIKEIVKLREKGLKYEEIKYKRMSDTDWESFFRELKKSSGSDEAFVNAINKIPYMSNAEKGRLRLVTDLTEHLTRVAVKELVSWLDTHIVGPKYIDRFNDESLEEIFEEVYHYIEYGMSNILATVGIFDDEYMRYLTGEKRWKLPLVDQWPDAEMTKTVSKSKRKSLKKREAKK
ncbi:MAG: hypothetical protein SCARUB_04084 [Candidatus Scalindua rubra]|uniref:Uncharacterized protein n=1 Tax=Candidatus Scalindua rubra TaxID=1872076 RepID=A0A1E3X544_9BACT|nr:MAG: hypothetical protein SCARUB_04084 [Candidatus Scalindua rubra]